MTVAADHKEVWICTIDPEVDDATVQARFEGKRTWRIGSTCGPKLEMTSAATWMDPRKDLRRIMQLAIEATSALDTARTLGVNHWALTSIAENLEKLKSGQVNRHGQRVLRSHVNGVKQVLKEIQTNDNGCGRAILVGARNARPAQV